MYAIRSYYAINKTNGKTAMQMRIIQQYIGEFENIVSEANTTILPLPEAELNSILQTVIPALNGGKK